MSVSRLLVRYICGMFLTGQNCLFHTRTRPPDVCLKFDGWATDGNE